MADCHAARAGVCAALAAVLACGHTGATRPRSGGSAAPPPTIDSLSEGSIDWADARRLSWSDFVGVPQMSSENAAVTSYILTYSSECSSGGFSYRVTAAFVPQQSWVKPAVVMLGFAGRRALQHEQTHFDLAEVHARTIRRALGALTEPCRMSEEERHALVAGLIEGDPEGQRRYDAETANGRDYERQDQWDTQVARALAALKQYAQ